AATSTPATLTVTTGPTVSFIKSDLGTQGSWKGVYGADGYAIANDSTALPSYAGFNSNNAALYTWDPNGADPRDLQRGSGAGQIASTWFAPAQFAFDVNITDGRTHQIALYALDWDAGSRSETIDILDASTNAVLDSRSVASFVAGQYLVWNISGHLTIRVTNQNGPNAVISGVFFGTPQAPAITQNPANVSVNPGQTATFTVTASGSGLSYQWQSKPGTSSKFANISGATSAGYTTPPAGAADNGTQFLCIVSNTAGSTTSTAATLTVTSQLQPPTITQNPSNAAVSVGKAATFTVSASGSALTYQWQSKPGTSSIFANIQGATSASYTTLPASTSDNGTQFLCIVSNSAGTATSSPATLTVTTGPSATFLQVDSTTQGNWKGLYGADGYGIATSTLSYPSYAAVTVAGASTYVWNSSTSDVRALQISAGQGLAACWYSGSPFTIDLNLTDSNTHKVSIYFLDWDSANRGETVAISDASTGAVLDTRTLTAFSQGLYLAWNIQGHVKVTITLTGGANSVASGIFFR
ncbi:MAG: hypothetical protein JWO80_520, partial [Bryobacterales bacterium]|nr:hypothetical protein [Bryobacterales bacterium]